MMFLGIEWDVATTIRVGCFAFFCVCVSSCGKSHNVPSADGGVPVEIVTAEQLQEYIKGASGKVTMLHLWATWCGPCVKEFPFFVKLHDDYKDKGLAVLFVSMDTLDDRDVVDAFLAEYGVDWQTYIASEVTAGFIGTVSQQWQGTIPVTFLYGEDHTLLDWWQGPHDEAEHERRVRRALELE
jgi:thiol-disulfide isomerase/thioredoxin